MSVENISQIYGVVLSLLFAYVPTVKTWFDGLSSVQKAQVMIVSIFVGLAVVFGLSCAGLPLFGMACTVASAYSLLTLLVNIAIANQAAYFLLVRPFKK